MASWPGVIMAYHNLSAESQHRRISMAINGGVMLIGGNNACLRLKNVMALEISMNNES
jgi:hypothetical protein